MAPNPDSPLPAADALGSLSAADFAAAVTAITSAFGDPTRRRIYLFAHEAPRGVTAAEVADEFDLHPNVARHHLDKLAGGGYLEVSTERGEHAGAGRPSKRYRSTAERVELDLPVRHDDLLVTLLGRALALLSPKEATAMAEDVGRAYGHTLAQSLGGADDGRRSFRSALHAVADALTAHGFAAHADERGDALRIVNEHCPFGDAAIEHPVICAVDRGMVAGMLSALYGSPAAAELAASLPMGDRVCVTTVEG